MLKKRKSVIDKIPYKYVIYLCVLGLIGILLVYFSIYSYLDYQKTCEEIAGRDAAHKANSVVSQVDERLGNLRQYYISSMEEDDILWILENNLHFSDYSRYKAALDVMANKKIFGGYITGYTFVNFRTGWVLSNKGIYKLEEAHNGEVLEDLFAQETGVLGRNYWSYDSTVQILTAEESMIDRKYRVTVETGGLSLVMKLPSSNLNPYGLFIVNVDMNAWQSWMNELLAEYEDVVVLDSQGQVIHSTDERLNAESIRLSQEGSSDKNAEKINLGGGINLYGIFQGIRCSGLGILRLL